MSRDKVDCVSYMNFGYDNDSVKSIELLPINSVGYGFWFYEEMVFLLPVGE